MDQLRLGIFVLGALPLGHGKALFEQPRRTFGFSSER